MDKLFKINLDVPDKLQIYAQAYNARLIHVSSCSIYKNQKEKITEASELQATSNYERSKIGADNYLMDYSNDDTVIVRPGLIYGPNTKHLGSLLATIPVLLNRVGINTIPNITGGPKTNWTYVDDLAQTIIEMTYRKNIYHSVYNVVESEPQSFGDTFTTVCKLSGMKVFGPPISIPPAKLFKYINKLIKRNLVFDITNGLVEALWNTTKVSETSKLMPFLEKEMCSYLEGDMIFSNEQVRSENLYFERFDHRHAWANALHWYRCKGWI
jgi:nucleoside-diphosphate-sugar epimerase